MDREIAEAVRLLEAVGFRCGHGTMEEAVAAGADFWCPDDDLPVPITVEAEDSVDLAVAVAIKLALAMVHGDPEGFLAQVGMAEGCPHGAIDLIGEMPKTSAVPAPRPT